GVHEPGLVRLLADRGRELARPVVVRGPGLDLVRGELAREVADRFLLGGEVEADHAALVVSLRKAGKQESPTFLHSSEKAYFTSAGGSFLHLHGEAEPVADRQDRRAEPGVA